MIDETQKELPTTKKKVFHHSEIEEMHVLGAALFKRPPVVQLHWETKRFSRCDDCDRYFEMGKYKKE